MTQRHLRMITMAALTALASAYLAIVLGAPLDWRVMGEIWWCTPIGVFAALVANATGAGGGVVFVPVFSVLRAEGLLPVAPDAIVGASFLIQCFGMSIGALTWFNRLYGAHNGHELDLPRGEKLRIMAIALAAGLPALLVTQRVVDLTPDAVLYAFKGFSIALGLALLVSAIAFHKAGAGRTRLARHDGAVLAGLCAVGGAVTALFSVGIGEFLALYLLVRGYPMRATVASAVIVSAVCVVAGAGYHVLNTSLPWEIIALAAPGVALGGFLARRVAYGLGERRLKIAASVWIVGSSGYLLFI